MLHCADFTVVCGAVVYIPTDLTILQNLKYNLKIWPRLFFLVSISIYNIFHFMNILFQCVKLAAIFIGSVAEESVSLLPNRQKEKKVETMSNWGKWEWKVWRSSRVCPEEIQVRVWEWERGRKVKRKHEKEALFSAVKGGTGLSKFFCRTGKLLIFLCRGRAERGREREKNYGIEGRKRWKGPIINKRMGRWEELMESSTVVEGERWRNEEWKQELVERGAGINEQRSAASLTKVWLEYISLP